MCEIVIIALLFASKVFKGSQTKVSIIRRLLNIAFICFMCGFSVQNMVKDRDGKRLLLRQKSKEFPICKKKFSFGNSMKNESLVVRKKVQ